MNIEKKITEFQREELKEKQKSKRKERIQVNINPDSMIGKEIKYQTALLHEILSEIRKQTIVMDDERNRNGRKPPVSNYEFSNENTE